MANNVKWIKFIVGCTSGTSFLKMRRAKIGGVSYRDKLEAVWFELLDFASKCNHEGAFIDDREIPYSSLEDIACMIDREEKELELCMAFYEKEGMIEIIDNIYMLSNWNKYQDNKYFADKREYDRIKQQEYRARKKELANNNLSIVGKETNNINEPILEEKKDVNDTSITNVKLFSISISNSISNIYTYWNNKDIIKHRELTKQIEEVISKALKTYTEDTILLAIDRYKEILDSKYFFDYKWTLVDFLKRKDGISSFFDEGSKWNSYTEWRNKNNIDFLPTINEYFEKTWQIVVCKENKEQARQSYITCFVGIKNLDDLKTKANKIYLLYKQYIEKWEEEETEVKYIPNFANWLKANVK